MLTSVLEKMPDKFWQLVETKKLSSSFVEKVNPESQIAIIRTSVQFDKKLLDEFPKLKLIIRAGSGFDNIDVQEALLRDVAVCNTPEANSFSAFEHTISLMMALIKGHQPGRNAIMSGSWKNRLTENLEFSDLRVLVVGVGRVGSRVANFLLNIGAKVKCVDPFVEGKSAKKFAMCSYEEGLLWCNMVSFHCPLYSETYHYFDFGSLELIKNPLFLLNVARGSVVNEDAVVCGLDSGKIRGVALDVFSIEPTKAEILQRYTNVYLTPHTGAYTAGAKDRMSEETLEVWQEFVENGRLLAPVDLRFI